MYLVLAILFAGKELIKSVIFYVINWLFSKDIQFCLLNLVVIRLSYHRVDGCVNKTDQLRGYVFT